MMYKERVARNLRKVINEHGFEIIANRKTLESITSRQCHNVEKGFSVITLSKLEDIADEIGADMLEFFRE